MNSLNQLNVDGKQLLLLVTIYDSGSLSNAAKILALNQSTVSYWLDRLRALFDDPLFVREGQGVVATPRTEVLVPKARDLLKGLAEFVEQESYDPAKDEGELIIAANSAERDVFIKPFLEEVMALAPSLQLTIVNSGSAYQLSEALRRDRVNFAIYPTGLLTGDGLMQKVIIRTDDVIYYDPEFGSPPITMAQYCQRPHAKVVFGPNEQSKVDTRLEAEKLKRMVRLKVSDFESLASLIQGTDMIATLPSFCKLGALKHFQISHVPWDNTKTNLAISWNARNNSSQRLRFWRDIFIQAQRAVQTRIDQVEHY